MAVRSKDLNVIRRGCSNRDIRTALVTAMKSGVRYRMTKSGVILYGDNGRSVAAHFTVSDRRASLNLWSELRAIGVEQVKK